MKYIKAILCFFLGILETIIMFPIMLIATPIRRYNECLFGKKRNIQAKVIDFGDKIHILLPNGEEIIAKKEVK